jgi:uncharacterized protein YuzE
LDESPIVESEEVSPGVILDFNEQNQVVGIEMLNLSKRAPGLNPELRGRKKGRFENRAVGIGIDD